MTSVKAMLEKATFPSTHTSTLGASGEAWATRTRELPGMEGSALGWAAKTAVTAKINTNTMLEDKTQNRFISLSPFNEKSCIFFVNVVTRFCMVLYVSNLGENRGSYFSLRIYTHKGHKRMFSWRLGIRDWRLEIRQSPISNLLFSKISIYDLTQYTY